MTKLTNTLNRHKLNLILFIIIYFLMGLIKGIDRDGLMSYVYLSMPKLSNGIGIYTGISLLISFLAVLLVSKIGFKKIFVAIYALFIISTIWIMFTHSNGITEILLIFIELGRTGSESIITLALMAYAKKESRVKIFAYAIFFNVLGEFLTSFIDGKLIVFRFKELLGVSYSKASALTTHVKSFKGTVLLNYMDSYKFILWITVIIALLLIILVLFSKEEKIDYKNFKNGEFLKLKDSINLSVFKDKYIIAWIVFTILTSLEGSLVTSHLPIYLSRTLHISRGTVSTILSLRTLGMMVFVLISPYIAKKLGSITSTSMFFILVAPLLILFGLGGIFGQYVVIAMCILAFLTWGCTHATHPVMDILPLKLVSKGARPLFTAIITLICAIISIISGFIAKDFLFKGSSNYEIGFFIVAISYILAGILLFVVYRKKFNRE